MATITIMMFKQFIVIHVLLVLHVLQAKIIQYPVVKDTIQIEQQPLVQDVHLVTIAQLREQQNFKCFHKSVLLEHSVVHQLVELLVVYQHIQIN